MTAEIDVDCTINCKLIDHGNLLTKSLTKRQIDENKLISFMVLKCQNFLKNLDENGRSALHVACSNSKAEVAEFLLKSGANIQQKDTESSWTPLHRSIHYACLDICVLLRQYGASFDSLDSDFFTPLQLIPQPAGHKIELSVNVWGKNKNYNLGIGNVTTRNHPDAVKGLPTIVKASINKYHSLFLASNGSLWGCGHSKEGRLGIGSEATLTNPLEISVKFNHKNEKIVELSAGLSHSLVLTNKAIYAAGSNKHLQLGIKNVDASASFKEISLDRSELDFKNMLCIQACDYHSLFVSRNSVFVCGLNVGQFGGIQESIAVPRRLPYPMLPNLEVEWASSNNCCICVYLNDKKSSYLYIYYNRRMKTYKNPLNEKLKQCAISGGEMLYNSDEIVKNSSQKPLTVTFMTQHNNLYIWYEDIMQFVKIHISTLFTTQITSIAPSGDDILVLANEHLFQATIQHKVPKMYHLESEYQEFSSKRDIAQYLCSKMSIKRIQHLSNVRKFYSDADGESFIAILAHSSVHVKDPDKEKYDFTALLDDNQFQDSGIMDVSFVVQRETFRANRFVVASRCDFLKNLLKDEPKEANCTIKDERLTSSMFQCILLWIYKDILTESDLKSVLGSATEEKLIKKLSQDFQSIALEWKMVGISNALINNKPFSKFLQKPDVINLHLFKWFSMENLPELYDVTILLDENQKLRAHKVVLMMRIEYFKMMFYHSWSEDSTIDLRHVSINFMKPIIQFAYSNDEDALKSANYTENFLYNMCAILDQYLIENVKSIFESMIMRKVNLRNCAENLEFSFAYNCHQLKDFCMKFISVNLSRLLEGNVLDTLDNAILKELSLFYRKHFNFETDSSHIVTPAFDAPTDEEIEATISGFDLASYYDAMQQGIKKTPKGKSKLTKSELLKRNYEKEGTKNLRIEDVIDEPTTPKSPEVSNNIINRDIKDGSWQQKRERKDSGKRKVLAAVKCNEIIKNELVQHEPMVDLRNLRTSISEEPEPSRNVITLADFGIKMKKKVVVTPTKTEQAVEVVETKPAWNMDNAELKPVNQQTSSDPFNTKYTKKKTLPSPKQSPIEKNFSSIVRDERKDKSNYEKIKSKSLILTQIEEQAIMELSEFYNIDNIFDENITIQRKVHKTLQNLSQWQHSSGA